MSHMEIRALISDQSRRLALVEKSHVGQLSVELRQQGLLEVGSHHDDESLSQWRQCANSQVVDPAAPEIARARFLDAVVVEAMVRVAVALIRYPGTDSGVHLIGMDFASRFEPLDDD